MAATLTVAWWWLLVAASVGGFFGVFVVAAVNMNKGDDVAWRRNDG